MIIRPLTAAAVIATTMLVGCGDDDGSDATTETDPAPAETVVGDVAATTDAPPPETSQPEVATVDTVGDAGTETTHSEGDATGSDDAEVDGDGAGELEGDDAVIADAFRTVFDSSVAASDKVDFVEEGDELAGTLDEYVQAGEAVGGITLEPTDVVIDGDTAAVTYDVLFAGTVQYEGQEGQAINAGGEWIVPREQLCGFLAAARVSCP